MLISLWSSPYLAISPPAVASTQPAALYAATVPGDATWMVMPVLPPPVVYKNSDDPGSSMGGVAGRFSVWRALQKRKASLQMAVAAGRLTEVRDSQPSKALSPMV